MQARELMNTQTREWSDSSRTMNQDSGLYRVKLEESKAGFEHDTFKDSKRGQKTLHQSVKEEGVKSPVTLSYDKKTKQSTIEDGHHRIAAANDVNPEMYIPVRYKS